MIKLSGFVSQTEPQQERCNITTAHARHMTVQVSNLALFAVRKKVDCCFWLAEFKYPVIVQRWYLQEPLARHSNMRWHK